MTSPISSIHTLQTREFPSLLLEITDPPKKLYIRGTLPGDEYRYLCVVGSRKYSQYGKEVCEKLIAGLRGYPVAIVSGLALGIDSIAHETAIAVALPTIAIPGSGIDEKVLYPRSHIGLARKIIQHGGALLSEYEPDMKATLWSFPQRNRIMAGISHAILVIEAIEKSGTLITARLGMEYNRDVLAVPGSLFSKHCHGPHKLLREGAQAVTSSEDILGALKIPLQENVQKKIPPNLSEEEQQIIALLETPRTRDELIVLLEMPIQKASIYISTLEIKGVIDEKLGKIHLLL